MPSPESFSARVVRWQRRHGRHDLPWQGTRDAYRIWLSEVMLQQTQVTTVIPYYERFLARFPSVAALAAAPEDDVLALWSGLGYYARARNLHRAAKSVMTDHAGVFPTTFDALVALPGIGRSTAAAIAAFASGELRAILDGNVKRVIARHAGIGGDPASNAVVASLWEAAEARLPARAIESYTQGLMDLGATVCVVREPACATCPVALDCVARGEDRIAELPGRKRRRESPRRAIAMLVTLRAGEVLLEKRPAKGIWGGLWSLPEFPADQKPPAGARALAPFTHVFTHFTLDVTPWEIKGTVPFLEKGSVPFFWLPLSELEGAALPAPVKKLLREVRSASAGEGTCAGTPRARSRRATRGASASRRS
ncbi:A/G-specific adenine glycosylase [Usitatibacter palustris]|uniref:Adenine DNA glycosylase n=1 Tax=Usitatibacter palustris TaxID=2732487 RepID=A0A6M4H1S2_9PROT|nr:A/G-specific adenine glycosylase [Usitatibacter palustris]QJR13295.1 Adenine DNA glycosylase [Usitatibacter palustris]